MAQPKTTPSASQLRQEAHQALVEKLKKIILKNPRYNMYDLMESMGYAKSAGDQRRFRLAIWAAAQQAISRGHFVRGPRKGERAGQYTKLDGEEGVAVALQQIRRSLAKHQRGMVRIQDKLGHIPKMFKSKQVQKTIEKERARITSLIPQKPTTP